MNIDVSVKNKVVTAPGNAKIICGNNDYTLTFFFDEEWNAERTRTARFVWFKGNKSFVEEVEFTGNSANVPILSNTHAVYVGVYAGSLRTTTAAKIVCEPSILCYGGEPTKQDPYTLERLQGMINKLMAESLSKAEIEKIINEHLANTSSGQGPPGVGISSVKQTTTSLDDGGTNVVTVSLTDGRKETFQFRNGSRGSAPVKGQDYWTDKDKEEILEEIGAVGGGGISYAAIRLLMTILGEALYVSDQTENIQKLKEALEKGAEDDPVIPDVPDIPDEPDSPVVLKLDAPVIRLETVVEPDEPDIPDEPDVPEGNTPAILGIAILGRTILGDSGGNILKLGTPAIRLATVADDEPKLNTPQIELVTVSDPEEPEPDVPIEPELPKLNAPIIHLETEVEPEPEEPTIPKLTAPEIYLEVIVPEVVKLATPTIRLEEDEDDLWGDIEWA